MNKREKALAVAVVGLVAFFGVALGFRALFLKPLRALDREIAAAEADWETIQQERRGYFAAEDRLKQIARGTFGDNADQAAAAVGEMLTREILRQGLRENDFTRVPTAPRTLPRRAADEIGWSVNGEGPLAAVVNLLAGLQEMPYLHRIENLVFTSADAPGNVKVRFRYLTLILNAPFDVEREEMAEFTVDEGRRKLYEGIVQRDILRPYIRRQPPRGGAVRAATPPPPGEAAPGPENYQIVSLSEWQGSSEIHVRDHARRRTTAYRIGDALGEGRIAFVDYSERPSRRNPLILSQSRVIIQIGGEFWGIDRGQTIADKYLLDSDEIPDGLKARTGPVTPGAGR